MSNFMQQMFGNGEEQLREILHGLPPQVKLAVGSYSGGNDSGGIDGVDFYTWGFETWDKATEQERGAALITANIDPDRHIQDALDSILSTKFGTWAGDWSAEGEIFVDVGERKCWTTGQMQVYEPDEDSINIEVR